jgi:hypothetical protein
LNQVKGQARQRLKGLVSMHFSSDANTALNNTVGIVFPSSKNYKIQTPPSRA